MKKLKVDLSGRGLNMNFDNLEGISITRFLAEVNFYREFGVFEWLKENGLLARSGICPKCSSSMVLQKKSSVLDGKVWRCTFSVRYFFTLFVFKMAYISVHW